MSRREAVAACVASRAGTTGNQAAAVAVDRELDGMKLGRDGRLASRQMSRQVMKIAAERLDDKVVLRSYLTTMERGKGPGHLPVCPGLTLGACGWKGEEAVAAYLYQTASGGLLDRARPRWWRHSACGCATGTASLLSPTTSLPRSTRKS